MSKKDRMLTIILATLLLNTNAVTMSAFAETEGQIEAKTVSCTAHVEVASQEASRTPEQAVQQAAEAPIQEKETKDNAADSTVPENDEFFFEGEKADAVQHKWSNWQTAEKATASKQGLQKRTCSLCGEIQTRTVNMESMRLFGNSRYDTSLAIADQLKKENGGKAFDSIIIACGTNFADALSASYLAKVKNAPILIIGKQEEDQMLKYINANASKKATIYIIGGKSAVAETAETKLKKTFTGKNQVIRLWGSDRFATNLEVLKEAKKYETSKDQELLVASGMNYADALSASAVGKPILLTSGIDVNAQQKDYLSKQKYTSATIIGGLGAVNAKAETEVRKYISKIDRLSGSDRFETSYLVADKYFKDPNTIVLTYGLNFPDGLCGGPLALKYSSPLLLVDNNNTSYANKYASAPAGKSDGILDSTVALGGEKLISPEALAKIITKEMKAAAIKAQTVIPGTIEQQPVNCTVSAGETLSFSVKTIGDKLSYQWQKSLDGKSWSNISGKTASKLSLKSDKSYDGMMFRCVITSACGEKTTSETAIAKVYSMAIIKQPDDWSGAVGSKAYIYAECENKNADLSWQYSTDNGLTWNDTKSKENECIVDISAGSSGRLYRCVMSDPKTGERSVTRSVKITANEKFGIIKQPQSQSGDIDSTQRLTVQSGGKNVKYQWQISTDGKTGWTNVTGTATAVTARLNQQLTPLMSGRYYRCVVTDASGKSVVTEPTRLTVNKTGFVEYKGKKFYLQNDHSPAKGIKKIGTSTYGFSSSGEMLTGLSRIGNDTYFFDDNSGVMKTGVVETNNTAYCFGSDGKAISGWHTTKNGDKYYFSTSDKKALRGVQKISGKEYYFASNGKMQAGVVRYPDGKYRYLNEGTQVTGFVTFNGAKYYVNKSGVVLTGLQKINGDTYYFGKDGSMLTGGYLIDGKRYFFDVDSGKAITGIKERENGKKYYYNGGNGVGTGLKKVGNNLYCFNDKGEMVFGYQRVDGKLYCFDNTTGVALSGWKEFVDINGNSHHFYFSSTTYAALTGLHKIGEDYYYFNENNVRSYGVRDVDGKYLLFDKATGKLQTGWYDNGNYIYYYDGINGRICGNKCVKIDGKYYYFNDYGVLCSGIRTLSDGKKVFLDPVDYSLVTALINVDGKIYFSDGLNGLKTGRAIIGGNDMYFSPTGYIRRTGYQVIDNKAYWYDENTGIRSTGLQYNSSNERYYMFDNNGLKTGFSYYGGVLYKFSDYGVPGKGAYNETTNPYGFRVYFDDDTGEQQLGLIEFTASSGKTYTYYYLEKNCITSSTVIDTIKQKLVRAEAAGGWQAVEGLTYYAQNGKFVKGLKKIDGKTYYFSSRSGARLTGLRRIGSDYYFFSSKDGSMQTGWQTIEGKKFWFDSSTGKMLTGLQSIGGKTYCLLQGGGYATGTVMIGTDTYKFASDGTGSKVTPSRSVKPGPSSQANSWGTVDGAKCYYGHDGKILTGLQIIDYKLYLFDTSGKMLKGLQSYNGVTRCYTDNGVLLGLQTVNGKLYYFDEAGAALMDKVKVIDDKTYYFTKDGSAATGFCYVPEYLCTYYFDKDHTAHKGWLELDGKKYYYYPQADFYVPGTPAHGVSYVGGKTYYFDYETAQQKTGLIKVGLNRYMYFDPKTGSAVTGLKNINGSLYLFSSDKDSYGVSLTGLQKVGNDTYYFDPNTQKASKGFVTTSSATYYFDSDFKIVKGLKKIGNDLYFFSDTYGNMRTGQFRINNTSYCFGDNGKAISGWYVSDSGDRYYYSSDDHKAYTGIHIIDSRKYYFNDYGILRTGLIKDSNGNYHYIFTEGQTSGFVENKGRMYYADPNGNVYTGLKTINGSLYYFNDYGIMLTGFRIVNNKRYFFDYNTGKAVTGFIERENGYTYYFGGANGTLTGLQKISGKSYNFSEYGSVLYGRRKIGNKYYFFDTQTGEAVSGWKEFAFSSGEWHRGYFSPDDLAAVTGLRQINGKYYFFNEYGYAVSGLRKVNDVLMYFDPVTNVLYTGIVSVNGRVYYCDGIKGAKIDKTAKAPIKANTWGTLGSTKCYYGTDGRAVTGLHIIDSKLYLFDNNGTMRTGLITYGGKTRYYTANGVAVGLQSIGSSKYYFDTTDGSMITGLRSINDKKYYFGTDGKQHTGWITINSEQRCYFSESAGLLTGLQKIGGKTYWFGTSGIMQKGVITISVNGKDRICCFGDDGAMVSGLTQRYGEWYYYDETTGARVTGWKTVGNNTYYFDESSGAAVKGKRLINNYNYYFDPETAIRKTGVIKVGKYFYNFSTKTKDGLSYGLTKINGDLYNFFEGSGASQFGFAIIDDVYYYFSEDSGKAVEGIQWVNKDSAYFFEKTGGVRKGLVTYGGKKYYLYPSNGKVTTGLISIGDKLYCFNDKGEMMTNTTTVICGITYKIDDNGYVSVVGNSKIAKMIRSGINKLGIKYLDEDIDPDDPIDPSNGYNCSSFVTKLLSDINIMVPSIAYRQQHIFTYSGNYKYEYISSFNKLKPGDIIYLMSLNCLSSNNCCFFNHVHHVMIYLGDGKMMHSAAYEENAGRGVNVSGYNDNEVWFTYKIIRLNELN